MTREELKYVISSCGCFIYRGHIYYEETELMKAFEDMGLIEQSGDAISRQAVLDLVADYDLSMGQVVRGIHALPSVNPQEKTGHWIEGKYKDICDKCRCTYPKNIGIKKYCPNCGVKMQVKSDIKQGLNYADEDTLMPAT